MSHTVYNVDARKEKSLKGICFQAVRKHFVAVGTTSIVGESERPKSVVGEVMSHAWIPVSVCVCVVNGGGLFICYVVSSYRMPVVI